MGDALCSDYPSIWAFHTLWTGQNGGGVTFGRFTFRDFRKRVFERKTQQVRSFLNPSWKSGNFQQQQTTSGHCVGFFTSQDTVLQQCNVLALFCLCFSGWKITNSCSSHLRRFSADHTQVVGAAGDTNWVLKIRGQRANNPENPSHNLPPRYDQHKRSVLCAIQRLSAWRPRGHAQGGEGVNDNGFCKGMVFWPVGTRIFHQYSLIQTIKTEWKFFHLGKFWIKHAGYHNRDWDVVLRLLRIKANFDCSIFG